MAFITGSCFDIQYNNSVTIWFLTTDPYRLVQSILYGIVNVPTDPFSENLKQLVWGLSWQCSVLEPERKQAAPNISCGAKSILGWFRNFCRISKNSLSENLVVLGICPPRRLFQNYYGRSNKSRIWDGYICLQLMPIMLQASWSAFNSRQV